MTHLSHLHTTIDQVKRHTLGYIIICILFLLYACNQINGKNDSIAWASSDYANTPESHFKYNNELYTGILKDSFPNGKIKFEKHYEKGLEHGKISGWHHNGSLSYLYQSDHGKKDGKYVEYYPSGKLQISKIYKGGVLVSNKILDINGKVLVNFKNKNGRIYGLLGSSVCRSVYDEKQFINQKNNK